MVFGMFGGPPPSMTFQTRIVRVGLVLWGSCVLAAIATFVIGPPAGRAGYAGKRVAPDAADR